MSAEWTDQIPDPSPGPPQPRHSDTLRDYAETLMLTLAEIKGTQVQLELHGKILVLAEQNSHKVYAIGRIDYAD